MIAFKLRRAMLRFYGVAFHALDDCNETWCFIFHSYFKTVAPGGPRCRVRAPIIAMKQKSTSEGGGLRHRVRTSMGITSPGEGVIHGSTKSIY